MSSLNSVRFSVSVHSFNCLWVRVVDYAFFFFFLSGFLIIKGLILSNATQCLDLLQEELRNSVIAMVKQSEALNRAGNENLKPRQFCDAIYEEIQ